MLKNIVAERVLGLPEAAGSEREARMDFDFNDEQREIKSTARDFLACRFKPEKVRELAESDSPYDDALWERDLRARLARHRASPRSTAARGWARSSW